MEMISPGRWRGLKTTSTFDNVFAIVAFDQRGTYRKMLPGEATYEEAVTIKQEVVTALSTQASAVLLDNEYGLPSALHMSGKCGLLLALEKSGYTGDSTYRRVAFDPDWPVAKLKGVGASAVKLLVYYHPGSGVLAEEIEDVVRGVVTECHRYDMPIFVEPVSYSLDTSVSKESPEFAATRAEVVRETARRLSQTGADVLKMEFPIDAAFDTDEDGWRRACEAISEVCSVPWVLLSAGVEFETFARQTQVACEAGASGFLAGRAIWKESVVLPPVERERFLADVALPRLQRLTDIATKAARPWTTFYTPHTGGADWFRQYQVG